MIETVVTKLSDGEELVVEKSLRDDVTDRRERALDRERADSIANEGGSSAPAAEGKPRPAPDPGKKATDPDDTLPIFAWEPGTR